MDTIPRNDFILRHRYDAFCKAVLRNEAKDYLREMGRQRDREKSFECLTPEELEKLSTVDYYPSDSYVFSSHGYDLPIDNELVAEAFASLPQQEQSILILHCVLDLADGEIASLMGMSRSAVQRHRTSTLKQLRLKLMALMPEGGKKPSPGHSEMRPELCIIPCSKIFYYFYVRPEGLCPSGRILLFPASRTTGPTLFQKMFKKVAFSG